MRQLIGMLPGIIAIAVPLSIASAGDKSISGRITVSPSLQSQLADGDRLVLKLFHPDQGVEKDLRYWIIDTVELPHEFDIAPSTDMNGRARWSSYVLEVFTDRDGDVLNPVSGELFATTSDLVPLGTTGLQLELTDPER